MESWSISLGKRRERKQKRVLTAVLSITLPAALVFFSLVHTFWILPFLIYVYTSIKNKRSCAEVVRGRRCRCRSTVDWNQLCNSYFKLYEWELYYLKIGSILIWKSLKSEILILWWISSVFLGEYIMKKLDEVYICVCLIDGLLFFWCCFHSGSILFWTSLALYNSLLSLPFE